MKKQNTFGVEKVNVLLICLLVAIFLFAGCSAGTPNAGRIKKDLNASDIVDSEKFLDEDETQIISVTKVSVVDKQKRNTGWVQPDC